LGVPGTGLLFPITDSTPQARRQVVDIAKCDACHRVLTEHGQNRTQNIELCTSCHNPNATDIGLRTAASGVCAAGTPDNPIDFKYFIHQIHASGTNSNPLTVCAFGSNPTTFNVGYPNVLNNCLACHETGTYYPVDPTVVQGTTIHAGADRTTLADDVVISPNTAVCSSCHIDTASKQHMVQNGGDFTATKSLIGTLISPGFETCSVCHGSGGVADVAVVHNLASFQ
jgi:OmcA/MtrC family decaheme c-type cytochrome